MISLEEILVMTFGLLLRAMTSVHPHSGQGVPPMFGDYENLVKWQQNFKNLLFSKILVKWQQDF